LSEAAIGGAGKQAGLKEIIKRLHAGVPAKDLKRDFAELIRGVSAEDIAAMEQSLLDEGFPVEEIQRLCEVHVEVFESSLRSGRPARKMPGHPARSLSDENREAAKRLRRLRAAARGWLWEGRLGRGAAAQRHRAAAAAGLEELSAFLIHYVRKENQLFPYLERHDFTGPSRVMWGKHDEIRALFKEAAAAVREGPAPFARSVHALSAAMRRMFFMEERILIPNALKRLSDREWAEIRSGEDAIGFAWIKPGAEYDAGIVMSSGTVPGSTAAAPGSGALAAMERLAAERGASAQAGHGPAEHAGTGGTAARAAAEGGPEGVVPEGLRLSTGSLSPELLDLVLRKLPVDISVVDERDRVLYYSDSPERVFPRSPAVIGRTVQNCHPQKSVAAVERILQAFKDGRRDKAEFWIRMGERLVVIEYLALRDAEGRYRGTLEVSQDATELRALEGERRLLDWD